MLLVLDYHYQQTTNQLKYRVQLDTQALNLVTRYGSRSSHDLVSHNGSKLHLAYIDVTLTQFEDMVDHSNTLTRAYFSALIHYLVLLELDHVDHATTTTFSKTKVAKVDLTTCVQEIWPYQYVQQSIQLLPTCQGEPIELALYIRLKPSVSINNSALSSGTYYPVPM